MIRGEAAALLNLFALPPHVPFLDGVAQEWLSRTDDVLDRARGLILLPTRRAARGLANAFLRAAGGRPMLLPRITALGALDEAPLALAGAMDLPPAVDPVQRLAALARLILALNGAGGAPRTADRAWRLAEELAGLMDEAERAEIDLAARLPDAADPAFAAHWAETLKFLHIVTEAWPLWMAENRLMNPAARQVALLDAQARIWEQAPPDGPVLVAGVTAAIPAVCRLLAAVVRMPTGQVLLPAIDLEMAEAVWEEVEDSHPQAGLRRVLAGMGATRGDVRPWPVAHNGRVSEARFGVLARALLPATALDAWRDGAGSEDTPLPSREGGPPGEGGIQPPLPDLFPPVPPEATTFTHLSREAVRPQRRPRASGDPGSRDGQRGGFPQDHDPRRGLLAIPLGPRLRGDDGRITAARPIGRCVTPLAPQESGRAAGAAPLDLTGLSRLLPADQQQEAVAIAMVLRGALEKPGAEAALVTPDRELAGRVASELLRFGVVADDSAGEPLAETPPAVFLRLLVQAVAEELAPVPLLAALKHPLAGAGLSLAECRAGARALELAVLRGPRPERGLQGLRRALDRAPAGGPAKPFLRRVERCLEPALRMAAGVAVAPAEALAAMVAAAEQLAATDERPGPARLWAGEEGEALAERLAAVQAALPVLPDQPQAVLPGLLEAVLAGQVVRSRRALRGRGGVEHPRVFIWGLLEARLQSVDVLVLGGLAEGVWPQAADPGPWLSRPMRARVGLASPEEQVGQAAHDFLAAACSAQEVVLSCPLRREGAPAVPARWLVRLEAFLAGQGSALPMHPAADWTRGLDQPAGPPRPVSPPRPCPPLARRPRRLSVTEIETWLRDPYAIYARRVLRLEKLRPLDEETDAADYGMLVHAGLHRFLQENGADWPADAAERLRRAMDVALRQAGLREALEAWWAPRLGRIAAWVAGREGMRRRDHPLAAVSGEVKGDFSFERPGGTFRLTGRADRIERWADEVPGPGALGPGALAILDYKTGKPPTQTEVDAGLAPQLLLEAAMAEAGAFGPELAGQAAELTYWRLTGGFEPGAEFLVCKGDAGKIRAAVRAAQEHLCRLVDAFDAPGRCYVSRPHPAWAPRFSDYEQLARVAEWAAAEDSDLNGGN